MKSTTKHFLLLALMLIGAAGAAWAQTADPTTPVRQADGSWEFDMPAADKALNIEMLDSIDIAPGVSYTVAAGTVDPGNVYTLGDSTVIYYSPATGVAPTLTLTATVPTGMVFDHWDDLASTAADYGVNPRSVTLDSSSCGTRFAATCITLYTLTLTAGDGGTLTVAPAAGITATATTGIYTVVDGTTVTVIATPDSAHYLATLGGQTLNSNSADSLTFTVTADTTVSAVFNTKPVLTLAANEATWGNVSVELAMATASTASAVQIGDGTGTTYYFPIDNYFNYSCTEQIYTADEIGTSGTIYSISFYYNYGTAYTASNVTLYMKHVSRSVFSANTDCEPLSVNDIVWTGSIAPTGAGWYTFTLDTPFEYNGTDNLMVAFYDGTSGYPGTSYTWRQTQSPNSANMALRYYSDSANPDPYNLSGYTGSKQWYTYRSNIKLDIATIGLPEGVTQLTDSTYRVEYGTEVTLVADAAALHHVQGWQNEANTAYPATAITYSGYAVTTPQNLFPDSSTLTLTVTGDTTARALFGINSYDVTASVATTTDVRGTVSASYTTAAGKARTGYWSAGRYRGRHRPAASRTKH